MKNPRRKAARSHNFGDMPKAVVIGVFTTILASAFLITIDSVAYIHENYLWWIRGAEILLSVLFAIEYGYRFRRANPKRSYVLSFWGIIDFVAIFPLGVLLGSANPLQVLRLLRLAMIFKLLRIGNAQKRLLRALREVKDEIIVFCVMALCAIFLSSVGIYYFEHDAQPDTFSSIPACMWWAVITFTTVGYGDMFPVTIGGKIFTTFILIGGLALVAVPTGLFSTALLSISRKKEEEDQN